MTYDKKPANYPALDSHDKEIVKILCALPEEDIRRWAQQTDRKAVDYARILLDRVDLIVNPGLMPVDMSDAKAVLSKFSLPKKPTLWQRLFSKKVK